MNAYFYIFKWPINIMDKLTLLDLVVMQIGWGFFILRFGDILKINGDMGKAWFVWFY